MRSDLHMPGTVFSSPLEPYNMATDLPEVDRKSRCYLLDILPVEIYT